VFWSQYNDLPNSPVYPFGYGLSYSAFAYSMPKLQQLPNGKVVLSVEITNTSQVAGTETVQLYAKLPASKHGISPGRQLVDFQQLQLAAGATKKVVFMLMPGALAHFDAQGQKHLAKGKVTAWLVPNSADVANSLTFVID
jgi:beta-glucosidase